MAKVTKKDGVKLNQELLDDGFEVLRIARPKEEGHLDPVLMEEGDLALQEELASKRLGEDPDTDKEGSDDEDVEKGFTVIRKMPKPSSD